MERSGLAWGMLHDKKIRSLREFVLVEDRTGCQVTGFRLSHGLPWSGLIPDKNPVAVDFLVGRVSGDHCPVAVGFQLRISDTVLSFSFWDLCDEFTAPLSIIDIAV